MVFAKFGAFSLSKVNAFWKFGVDFWKFGVLKNERNEAKKMQKSCTEPSFCAIFAPFATFFRPRQPMEIAQNAHFSLQNAPKILHMDEW